MPISKNGAVAEKPKTEAAPAVAQTAPAPVSRKLDTGTPAVESNKKEYAGGNYDDKKNRRILVQGITQAVTQSMALAGLGYTNEKEVVELIKRVSRDLVAFVDEESK